MSNPSQVEKKLLHYTGKAIADFNMIQRGDRVMVCLSGGKDSFTLLTILDQLRRRSGNKFELFLLPWIRLNLVGMILRCVNGLSIAPSLMKF